MEGCISDRGIGWYLNEVGDAIESDRVDLVPHVAGLTALAITYGLAGALALGDGPLPFGDVIAVGILAIPDPLIYYAGYSMFD